MHFLSALFRQLVFPTKIESETRETLLERFQEKHQHCESKHKKKACFMSSITIRNRDEFELQPIRDLIVNKLRKS